jgi:alkylhydroperoxidase family enzyme
LEAGNFKLDQTRTKHWHARRQATVQTQSSLAAQPHRTALAASIGGSLTPKGNGLAVTVTVQHKLSPRAMSMLANVSRMYAECFNKVLYHINSQIFKMQNDECHYYV